MNNVLEQKRVAVAMIGARRHYAVPHLLHEAGCLEHFFTDFYMGNKPILEMLLKAIPVSRRPSALIRMLGRKDDALPADKITSFDLFGLWYVYAQRNSIHTRDLDNIFLKAAQVFAANVIKHSLGNSNVLWGFNGASTELFGYAKQRGIHCILDQTSNPNEIEQKLTNEEHKVWSEWLPAGEQFVSHSIFKERERTEWKLADTIVAGSSFVARGLIECGVPAYKIQVVTSGIDLNRFSPPSRSVFDGKRPLRILFVGRVSIMKGVPYLLKALKQLGPKRVEARLVGSVYIDRSHLAMFNDVASVVGAVPRSDIEAQYKWADVFCFPSITEGSATVTFEALASGLAVITTPNAGSIVRDGCDGYIVGIRDFEGLASAILKYYENPMLLAAHQKAAVEDRERVSHDRYQYELMDLVQKL
jgi:glycosyltransferase involved in cell wall biosynthesis